MSCYKNWGKSAEYYESINHYSKLMCMKCTNNGPQRNKNCNYTSDSEIIQNRIGLKHLCVLPKGHSGKCTHVLDKMFKAGKYTKKLLTSVRTAIYSTPGNDDYVYKNRANRLFDTVLSSVEAKKIRNKKQKKKCAIPLKDASTPICLSQAYIDWMTFVLSIDGIEKYKKNKLDKNLSGVMEMIEKNREYLEDFYNSKNRKVFRDGKTICVISNELCTLKDFADVNRDNREVIKDTDIQMGHNRPRSDSYVSICGNNLLPMSRRGNLILGEHVFTENLWINELRKILNNYN